jgi:hypothetical protein
MVQDTPCFFKEGIWPFEVMEHIEENKMRNGAVLERHCIRTAHSIEPGIRKQIGANCLGESGFQVPDSGAKLDDCSGDSRINE